jgi:hypothetical protein
VVEIHCIDLINLSHTDQTLPSHAAPHTGSKVSRGLFYREPRLIQVSALALVTVELSTWGLTDDVSTLGALWFARELNTESEDVVLCTDRVGKLRSGTR